MLPLELMEISWPSTAPVLHAEPLCIRRIKMCLTAKECMNLFLTSLRSSCLKTPTEELLEEVNTLLFHSFHPHIFPNQAEDLSFQQPDLTLGFSFCFSIFTAQKKSIIITSKLANTTSSIGLSVAPHPSRQCLGSTQRQEDGSHTFHLCWRAAWI